MRQPSTAPLEGLFTSESVAEGHPDKLADLISDRVLDALIGEAPASRVAVETLVTTGTVVVAGEVTTTGFADVDQIARDTIKDVGYTSALMGFDSRTCGVLVALGQQSPDIARGVDRAMESRGGSDDPLDGLGAGDQGLMFGYACRDTDALMPMPVFLAHRMSERLSKVRRTCSTPLWPDGKTQVTVLYKNGEPFKLDTVVVSAHHEPMLPRNAALFRSMIIDDVVRPVVEEGHLDLGGVQIHVNPTGQFVVGGPMGDTGLTGRKIIADTYGGMARHGGGAFSGKDPSKVDRSGAYAMRWVAKNIVAAGLADRCETRVAYVIGRSHPVGLAVDCFGTGRVPDDQILDAVKQVFDLRPAAIIDALDLRRPIYAQTTNYGHFGRDLPVFTWENTDRAKILARTVRG